MKGKKVKEQQATRSFKAKGDMLDEINALGEIPSEQKGSQIDRIISFEQELKMLQDDNMYPKDIFLQHCLQFAKSNFDQMQITVEEYQLTQKDIDDKVFFRESRNNQDQEEQDGFYDDYSRGIRDGSPTRMRSNMNYGQTKQMADEPVNIEEEYDILDIKIFPEVVLVNGKQQLIVKTWELIEKRKQGQQQTIQTKNHPFHLKTLRIYDSHSVERAQILTEQVDTKISSKLFYDSSILQFGDCIFYFKRIYGTLDESFSNSQKSGALLSGSRSMGDKDEDSDTFTNSYLQLFKYDLVNYKETMIDGYQLVEYNDDDRTFNIIFSQNFDNDEFLSKLPYKDEDEFLTDQYFLAQQYIHDDEEEAFAIFCMNNFDEPIHHESPENQNNDESTTKQIQYFNHRDILIEQAHKILFVMISSMQHMHLIHDIQECSSEDMQIYKLEKSFDRYQNPKLHIHSLNLNYQAENNKWISIDQQYYIDQRNQTHLMYPNYSKKSTKYKHIDLIKDITKIYALDQRQYKKIISIDYTQHMDNLVRKSSFIQPIKSLRKILNFEAINQDQIFTFCKDPLDQVLYITQPDVNQIYMILMRDHHCEECYDVKVDQQIKEINSLIGDYLVDNFQNFEGNRNQKRSKKSLTRMKKMQNHCKGRFKDFNIQELYEETDQTDLIEIDIDSQRIMVTRNQDLGNPAYDHVARQAAIPDARSKSLVQEDEPQRAGCYHVMIEDYKGVRHKILLFESNFMIAEELKTEIIQQNGRNYCFIFSALNYINGEKKVTYLMLQKPCEYVEDIIIDTTHGKNRKGYEFKSLIKADQELQIIIKNGELRTIKLMDVFRYQSEIEQSIVAVSFEKLVDINVKLNFIAMVYHESYNLDSNRLLIYDIDKRVFTQQVNINPNTANLKYLYLDDQGHSCFKICRSSEMQINPINKGSPVKVIQEQKFQVFTLYIETLGRIQVQEFLIKQLSNPDPVTKSDYIVQLIGSKQILLSNKCIKVTSWNFLKKSFIIPFFDEEHVQQGCQCIFWQGREKRTILNLIDQQVNNLFSYQSDIITIGSKRFELNRDDHEEFLIVISVKINDDIIHRNLLDQQESFKILRTMQEILLAMRKPDLEYVLLNSFDSLLQLDFFTPQEILFGKSLCDICLQDPNKIKLGLETFQKIGVNQMEEDQESHIQKSIVAELLQGDRSRTKSFKDCDFYPRKMIVNFDFNFNTTVYRGLKMKSMQSIKYLLDYLFDECNSINYYKLIMLDLHELMSSKINSHFLYFFEESAEERKAVDRTQFCNMEIPYSNTEIEQFSQYSMQFEPIKQFENLHDFEEEICQIIKNRMARQKLEKEKLGKKSLEITEYPIEHSYVDLNWLVIGEKMRSIKDEQKLKDMRFDHLFYADMILKQYNEMRVFSQRTIQKMVDFQFAISSKFMKVQFWFYFIFYVCPYSMTLVTENTKTQLTILKICIFPQVILMSIKLIQLWVQRCNFISGWNIIDVLQIICFQVLLQLLQMEDAIGKQYKIDPFVKIWLILLSFLKVVHFIIVYEEFGFFIKMITQSLFDLRPFFICYIFFTNFFVILYAVMEVEIDAELDTAGSYDYMGYYGLLFLAVWRNSVGKLGVPNYKKIASQKDSFIMPFSVGIIWIIYFVQVLFMLVIGLNFMIAIIESTFSSVNDDKLSYLYRNKAEMNLESFEILQYFSYFRTCEEYRAIIFSTFTFSQEDRQIVVHGREEEIEIMLEKIEKQMHKSFEVLKEQRDYCDLLDDIIKNQARIEKRIQQEFDFFIGTVEDFRAQAINKIHKMQKPANRRFTMI